MAFNGTGTFNRLFNWVSDAAASINITASRMDSETQGIADGLTNCLTKDGQSTPTANIKLGGFKLTGIGVATSSGDALSYGQAATVSTLTTTGAITSPSAVFAGALTGITTLNMSGLLTTTGAITGVTDLTTTGNTILGDASTDTLNVGAGGIVKDASGNVGFGAAPSTNLHLQRTSAAATARIEAITSGTAALELRAATAGGSATQISFYNVAAISWAMGGGNIGAGAANDFSIYGYTAARNVFTIANATGDITAQGIDISRSKAATTSRNTTTTLADDPDLIAPLGIGRWAVDVWFPNWGTTTGSQGIKAQLAFSGTATSSGFTRNGIVNGAVASSLVNAGLSTPFSDGTIVTASGTTNADWARWTGFVVVSVAGNFSLQWAQNSSSGNATNVGLGAWMSCKKVG